jgi:hypothetical protein
MYANSSNPTPKEEDNLIDNFQNRGLEPATLSFPAIMLFAERPTLKNAKSMLRVYKIHFPLSTLLPKKDKGIINRPYTKTNTNTNANTKGGAITSVSSDDIMKQLLILDTMHDLLNTDPLLVYNIFKNEIVLSPRLKNAFLSSQYSFTRDASNYIQAIANISITTSAFVIDVGQSELKMLYDVQLAGAISNWKNMMFVLDNFVANLQHGGGGVESKGTFTLIGCAYLIVLLANMKRLQMLNNKKKTITFIDGFFMKMDGDYVSRFLSLFCKTVKRITNFDTIVIPDKDVTDITRPKYFNKLFHTNAIIDDTHVTLNSNKYSIISRREQHNQNNQKQTDSQHTISFPHDKKQFFEYIKKYPKNKDLWYLNFLRDAFKADVAVETGSIFMTHDRLAHMYYKFIGGQFGFLLSLDQKVGETKCHYSVSY